MLIRILSVIMAVLVAASPAALAGFGGLPCEDHPCCCHGPSISDHKGAMAQFRSNHGCCCQTDSEIPCTLASNPLPSPFEAALSSTRADVPAPFMSGNLLSDSISAVSGDGTAQVVQGGGFQAALSPGISVPHVIPMLIRPHL